MRVYQLAKALGITSNDLITQLRADGEWLTSHMSSVPEPRVRVLMSGTTDRAKSDDALPAPQRDAKPSLAISQPSLERNPRPPARTTIQRQFRRRPGPEPSTFWETLGRGYDDYDMYDDPSSDRAYGPQVTTRDVARIFGVSQATVRMWVRRGHITPIDKLGPSHVFDKYAVITAHEAIQARTRGLDPTRLGKSTWQARPAVNIPAKYHDNIVDVRRAAMLARVRPATIRTWIHRGHLTPLPATQPRTVRLRVGDVFKAARRRRR